MRTAALSLLLLTSATAAAPAEPVPTETAPHRRPFDVQRELWAELPRGTDVDRALDWFAARGVFCRPTFGGVGGDFESFTARAPRGFGSLQSPYAPLHFLMFTEKRKVTVVLVGEDQ